jgi:hypothetical protein
MFPEVHPRQAPAIRSASSNARTALSIAGDKPTSRHHRCPLWTLYPCCDARFQECWRQTFSRNEEGRPQILIEEPQNRRNGDSLDGF